MKKNLIHSAFIINACLSFNHTVFASDTSNTEVKVELQDAIREQINSLPTTIPATNPLKQIQLDFTTGQNKWPAQSAFSTLNSNLTGINSFVSTAKTSIITKSLTLKGLIELAYVSETKQKLDIPINMVVYGISIYGVIETNIAMGSAFNTTSLSGDLAAIIDPQPGTKFSYIHSWEFKHIAHSIIDIKNTSKNTFQVTCSVNQPQSASKIHTDLHGDFLPVSCDGLNHEHKSFNIQYAYLLNSQVYIRLSESSSYQTTSYSLKNVTY